MKKITLGLFFVLITSIFSTVIAQVLNESANWPNASWTITGTFDPAGGDAFESDPTTTANFSYNDDDNATGGNQSFDDIAAESPIIDLTAAFNAGETWVSVAGNYVYNRVDVVGELLTFQYWDADAATWVNYPGGVFDSSRETVSQPTDNICTGDFEPYSTDVLNISGFTATQLSGFSYRIYYDDDADGGNAWEYGFCFDAPTISSETPPSCPDPSTLSATILNTTDVSLAWVENGSAASWDIEIVDITGGGTQTMTATYTDVSNPYVETMLTPGNDYEFYVQSDCGGSGTSNWVGPLAWSQPNLGNTCEAPIVVNSIPYTTTDDTANYGDDYNNGDSPCNGFYMSGDDVVYSYTPSSDVNVSISLTDLGDTWSGIHVLDGCIGTGTPACVAFVGNSNTDDRIIPNVDLIGGTTYYIYISTYAAPQSVEYTLNINENTCIPATVTYDIINDCDVSGGFLIDVTVSDLGSATDLTITNDQDATSYAVTSVPTTVQFGPYANALDVVVTTDDDNDDGSCTVTSDALTQAACPPDNTLCSTAELVTIGIGEDGPTVVGTNLNASDSGLGDPSCNAFYDGGDIWYEFTLPAGAVEVTLDVASSAFSSIIAVVYDNCIDLNEVYCNTIFSSTASFNVTGLTGGETYFLRLYDFGNDSIGDITFNINTPTLGVDDFETSGFSYFPNPVSNTLTLKAKNNIQNVAVYNMLGQEVLRTSPNSIESNVDMSGLSQGAYFVKVTIHNTTETIRIIKN